MQTCHILTAQPSINDMFALIELYGRKLQSYRVTICYQCSVVDKILIRKVWKIPNQYKWRHSTWLLSEVSVSVKIQLSRSITILVTVVHGPWTTGQ